MEAVTIPQINNAINHHRPILNLLKIFVEQNANPQDSPNLTNSLRDDLDPLSELLRTKRERPLLHLLLETFKILLRKEENRTSLPPLVLKSILSILKDDSSNSRIRAACSNVLLNATFEKKNVLFLLSHKHNGVHILLNNLRTSSDTKEKVSLAGALQSICFVPEGPDGMRRLEAESLFVKLLVSSSGLKFISRISGVLHNLSVDSRSSSVIRKIGGIQPIVNLLKYVSDPSIIVSASGALQNLARSEETSRLEILSSVDLFPYLSQLLFSSNPELQSCAVGVLLSVLKEKDAAAASVKQILSDCVALGSLHSALFDLDDSP